MNRQGEDGKVVQEKYEAQSKINYAVIETDAHNFAAVFNQGFSFAVEHDYEFVTFIEQEDVISSRWYAYANQYAIEKDKFDIFLPLIRNTTNGIFNNYMNEACWAEGMVDDAGVTDMNVLLRFNCIHPLGAFYRVSSIKNYVEPSEEGKYQPMKESMKISNYYEFFLRMTYNDIKIYTIPREGYEIRLVRQEGFKHTSSKIPSNLTQLPEEKGGISPEEGKFYMELARKEYFFDEDRKIAYGAS